jgi:7-cyano-7-deazaguanine synthase
MGPVRKKVLLSSGGMDSFLLAHEPELEGAYHVFVDVGQQYAAKERFAARCIAADLNAPFYDVSTFNQAQFEHKETGIIPFRNAELILCAAQYGEDVYLGVIADEVNSDKSVEFCGMMQHVLNICHRGQYWTEGRHFNVKTPFRFHTKTELVQRYLARQQPVKPLLETVSCYDGGERHCGRCSSCFKRWIALTNATGTDASRMQDFREHPGTWKTRAEWHEKLGKGYATRRLDETMRALDIAGV